MQINRTIIDLLKLVDGIYDLNIKNHENFLKARDALLEKEASGADYSREFLDYKTHLHMGQVYKAQTQKHITQLIQTYRIALENNIAIDLTEIQRKRLDEWLKIDRSIFVLDRNQNVITKDPDYIDIIRNSMLPLPEQHHEGFIQMIKDAAARDHQMKAVEQEAAAKIEKPPKPK